MDDKALYLVEPKMVQRASGGWLAITPRGWPLSIGVCGITLESTRSAFADELARWSAIDLLPHSVLTD